MDDPEHDIWNEPPRAPECAPAGYIIAAALVAVLIGALWLLGWAL